MKRSIHSGKKLAVRILKRGFSLLVPQKAKVPFRYCRSVLDGSIENELRYLHRITRGNGAAIDVGANIGMYSYKMSKLFSKVYAFEINGELTKELASYNPGNIEIVNIGLSSREGNAVLYIPILNGLPLLGWASLAPNNHPDTQEHIEKKVKVCPLDKFNIQAVSLIKIDVEGHEVEVLKGAIHTLTHSRPTVFIEIKQNNVDEVLNFFANLKYQKRKLENLIGITGSTENFIFLPS
jgi:FkbM family methyltransferase